MNAVGNDISLITVMALAALLPFVIAVGTCYIKFSVVFTLVRNGLGLQQVPSNLIANAIALMLAFFVMQPIIVGLYDNYTTWDRPIDSVQAIVEFMDANLADYRAYLLKYSDPQLLAFFERARLAVGETPAVIEPDQHSMFALLPAYALSELTDAFRIGFYLYLPFVVVDLVVSSILLSLGMMMMSPVTVSAPIKLILFVAMDGWSMISQGLVRQYLDVAA
ncbi:EscR/YscR/HrcR family type III secretion system export apparatus protein [Pseudoxanthomonas sp. UTMC 1351]|uniref:EscR/YscR/HrcR family type III secretion system export apparatus protein n=1 Tax=Pseudoxanthomonas sp. UTMC 1351 TaxID=2695853 RepID=UPI0034CDB503